MMSWKNKRIAAINRLSKIKRHPTSDLNPYFEQVQMIYKSKAKNLKEFKLELKGYTEWAINLKKMRENGL